MPELPFIQLNQIKEKSEDTNKGYKQKKTKSGVVYNPVQSLFKYSMGEKILKIVYDTKSYPDALVIGKSIYLEYQLKGKCFKSKTYNYMKSHSFISNNIFKKFMY